jgi:hypothetical protein
VVQCHLELLTLSLPHLKHFQTTIPLKTLRHRGFKMLKYLKTEEEWLLYVPLASTLKSSAFCTYNVLVGFIQLSEYEVVTSLYKS